jgi:GNAT superfamily N-acetyltransferase
MGITNPTNLTMITDVDEATRQQLSARVKAFNRATVPHLYAGEHTDPEFRRNIDVIYQNEDGEMVAGAFAEVYWQSAYIAVLWVNESLRGAGIGTELMHRIEAQAREWQCRFAWTRTFSWQAREFYERLGYRVTGRLDDHPPGHTFYTMRKDFKD